MLRAEFQTTMKNILTLLFLCVLACGSQAASINEPIRISFQRHAPAMVKRQLPRGVRSHFWGTFRLQSKGAWQGVCLYDPNWQRNKQKMRSGGNKIWLCADIFAFQRNNWKRLRHCNLDYYGYVSRRMQVGAELLWLRPESQSTPIFKFRIFSYDGSDLAGGGDEMLLIFPQGLKHNYAVQLFSVGYWRASDTLGQNMSYDDQDAQGFLQITSQQSLNDDIWTDRTTIYNWKPKKHRFIATWTKGYGGFGKPYTITNPKKLKELGL
jgi:hypothetical protein